jgi:hypothetical protein
MNTDSNKMIVDVTILPIVIAQPIAQLFGNNRAVGKAPRVHGNSAAVALGGRIERVNSAYINIQLNTLQECFLVHRKHSFGGECSLM